MARDFVSCERGQLLLMPPSLVEWLPEDHLVWTVLGAVDQLDLDRFREGYRLGGSGRAPYDPAMLGWIQLVVATPDVEGLLCRGEIGRGVVLLRPERVGVGIRLRGGGSIGSGSGRRSLEVPRARRLRSRRVCCRALVSGGSARVAVCRLSISRRCRGAICRLPSGRRSRCCSPVVLGSGRSRVGWVVRRRRSPESCNATRRSGVAGVEYRASTAQRHAERRAQRPKPVKLAVNAQLRTYVQDRLSGTVQRPDGSVAGPDIAWRGRRQGPRKDRRWGQCWSPEQISQRLRLDFPDDESMRVSHEAIYQSLYIQGRGALRRELTACLRTGRALRAPRNRTSKGQPQLRD